MSLKFFRNISIVFNHLHQSNNCLNKSLYFSWILQCYTQQLMPSSRPPNTVQTFTTTILEHFSFSHNCRTKKVKWIHVVVSQFATKHECLVGGKCFSSESSQWEGRNKWYSHGNKIEANQYDQLPAWCWKSFEGIVATSEVVDWELEDRLLM